MAIFKSKAEKAAEDALVDQDKLYEEFAVYGWATEEDRAKTIAAWHEIVENSIMYVYKGQRYLIPLSVLNDYIEQQSYNQTMTFADAAGGK